MVTCRLSEDWFWEYPTQYIYWLSWDISWETLLFSVGRREGKRRIFCVFISSRICERFVFGRPKSVRDEIELLVVLVRFIFLHLYLLVECLPNSKRFTNPWWKTTTWSTESNAQFYKKNFRRLRGDDLACPWVWKFWSKRERQNRWLDYKVMIFFFVFIYSL